MNPAPQPDPEMCQRTRPPVTFSATPYLSLNSYLKQRFGRKLYKLALDGGMTCPNRDGSLGTGGCIFCSEGGSGEFAAARREGRSVRDQLAEAKARIAGKVPPGTGYIAYFQSFTNTYAPVSDLRALFTEALADPEVEILSIATRPDCISEECLALLAELNRIKEVWVELGLQTIHEDSAKRIRRGYPLSVYEETFRRLKAAGLTVITHVILGLPGESREAMLETVRYLADTHPDGIKLQLLHILKGTDLAALYAQEPFPVMTREQYIDLVLTCLSILPPDIVIHRITGDGPKKSLIAPLWSADKKQVLNAFSRAFAESGIRQGCCRSKQEGEMIR